MKSKLFLGTGAGFIGALAIAFIIYLLYYVGINVPLITAISRIFVLEPMVGTFRGNIIGLIAHLMCGSIVGLVILIGLEVTGYNHFVLKGALFGGGIWFTLCGILAKILNIYMQGDFLGSIFAFLIHIIYGIITTWIITHYSSKNLTP